MPWLDHWLDKNPVYRLGPPNLSTVTGIAIKALKARLKGEDENFHSDTPDFLQHFISSMETHPEVVNEETIVGYLLLNRKSTSSCSERQCQSSDIGLRADQLTVIAGADTTATTIRAFFYYCLKDRSIWNRLESEIRARAPAGEPVSYAAAHSIPYLDAAVRETLRYHPVVSMIMERIVPEPGLVLPGGSTVPAGTLVGMNPYIVGRNKSIFGPDADNFRPDRWLQQDGETNDAHVERLQAWGTANLTFGGGSRICLGRHFSQVETIKVVATLIATFDIELDDPQETWWTSSRWFYRTSGVVCRVKERR
jgi:cytochrome P450